MSPPKPAALKFVEATDALIATFLSDYRREHVGDDPDLVDAYCTGFQEAAELIGAAIALHLDPPPTH